MATYDCSHRLETGAPVYPGDPPIAIEPAATIDDDGYRTTHLDLGSHAGTHVDAPAHLLADGRALDEYALETFRFDAVLADLAPLEPREPIDAESLADAVPEAIGGRDLLVVRTGWDERWGTDRYHDHPFLTSEAADRVVERGWHLGADTPNVDPTPTDRSSGDEPDGYPVHETLFGSGRLIVENLRGLGELPERFELRAYPLSIDAGDASPIRAVAVTD